MASTFFLAPIPFWVEVDNDGKPAANCFMRARSSIDHSQIKAVFQTSDNSTPWPVNEFGDIQFLPNGTQGPFYWEDNGTGELYYLQFFNENYELLDTIDDYPQVGGGGSGPITTLKNISNHIINGQFQFHGDIFPLSPIPMGLTPIQPTSPYGGWYFYSNIVGNTDSISFERPSLSSTSPPNNPLGIFKYSCTVAGSGTRLDLVYKTSDVKTYSNTQIAIQFQANASGSAPIGIQGEVLIRQFFGTGGSPSPEHFSTPIAFTFPSGVYAAVPIFLTVDSVGGKSLGTNNDDTFEIIIRFPIGSTGDYRISNVMQVLGVALPTEYIYDLYIETYYKLATFLLSSSSTGQIIYSSNINPPLGFLPVADTNSIGSASSTATYRDNFNGFSLFNLYSVWWDNAQGFTGQPVVVGGRGLTASADWNANKNMIMPSFNGRVTASQAGSPNQILEASGSNTHINTIPEMVQHQHSIDLMMTGNNDIISNGTGPLAFTVPQSDGSTHNFITHSAGLTQAWDIRQPTTYLYCYVSL